jgi:hypothetical protein
VTSAFKERLPRKRGIKMMKTTVSFIVLVILLCMIRNIIIGTWAWRDRTKARHERNKERTRRQFAEARNALMELVIAGEVDVSSMSFRFFYYINTSFMRRPDQYRDISGILFSLFLNQHDSSSGEELLAESKTWSLGFKSVVRETANALGYVVVDYSPFMRFVYSLERKFNAKSTPFQMLNKMRATMVENEKPIAEISQARQAMYRMADNPLALPRNPSLVHA